MSKHIFRVHPAIGVSRVGNSEEFYIGPETPAGMPLKGPGKTTGGLPIKPGTEGEPINSDDIRDRLGALKRQAARFKIYEYPKSKQPETWPTGEGKEIKVGSKIDGKKVTDIIWTVHLANKKANNYVTENGNLKDDELLIDGYEQGALPPIRNPQAGDNLDNAARIKKLVIDPGPRAVQGCNAEPVRFDVKTVASFEQNGAVATNIYYPKTFPDDSFQRLYTPAGNIDTLGQLQTDEHGRLLVVGGYGRGCSWLNGDEPTPIQGPVDNDGWFDDTGDGPVYAVIVLENGETVEVEGAWVICTDPSYAPQTLNVVSLWDDIYDTWLRKLELNLDVYKGKFRDKYKPDFHHQIYPIFRAASLQMWNTNLPDLALRAHEAVGDIGPDDKPSETILGGLGFIRNPNKSKESNVGPPLMPLSLGDNGRAFLSPSLTQYFFLQQWDRGHFHKKDGLKLGPGEALDRAVLMNCLGGRFSPGIDMTFIVRQPGLYKINWNCSGVGPFRIDAKKIDYAAIQPGQPVLSNGWVPLRPGKVEPGDTSKFMALPWHADYNSCAVHTTDPNPRNSTTLYWSWPAQRPVAVYAAKDVRNGQLPEQRFSVRGKGTETDDPATEGIFQDYLEMVLKWHRIGVIIQATQIDDGHDYPDDFYLEVESQLDEPPVKPWPNNKSQDDPA
ncbi:MAG: LodA/GoxA family CTQ-dependent oxidase [Acidobacteriota bacterium]|nr:LodA/GoxA family CTQ-dependent oxidase [Acidobacteriota bacterium]